MVKTSQNKDELNQTCNKPEPELSDDYMTAHVLQRDGGDVLPVQTVTRLANSRNR